MVGGEVVEVLHVLRDGEKRVWVNCRERQSSDECAIMVVWSNKARCICVGDQLWWQGGHAMWTPKVNRTSVSSVCGTDYDIQLDRIGASGVTRPLDDEIITNEGTKG